MLRRARVCLAVLLFVCPGCTKKDSDEAANDGSADAKPKPAQPQPAPPKPAGSSTGGAPADGPADLSCDPTLKAECLEGEQCIGGQGCDAVWSCDAEIVCKKGVREYCGCDGVTFEAAYGNCPTKKYQYPGPCK